MGIIQGKGNNVLKLNIKDTEFIIRLLNNSSIPGTDIEQAAKTLSKVKKVHSKLLEIEETI